MAQRFTFKFSEKELSLVEAALEEATISLPPGPWNRDDFAQLLNDVEGRLLY